MERQYIGARYVPKFFENPTTLDASWMQGVAYEALTVVTYAGNSYTSKKPVPVSVGAPNLNLDYWVATGNQNEQVQELIEEVSEYNQQVEGLRTDVSDLSDDIEKITNKKYICITDSYGAYYDANNKNFMQLAAGYAGIPETDIFMTYLGSGGFFRPAETNFLTALQNIGAGIADKTKITDIFVFGGANDQVALTSAEIFTGISNFCNYVKQYYPNAKVYIGFVSKTFAYEYYRNYKRTLICYQQCGQYGAIYLNGSENIMQYNKLFRTDHVHPTENAVTFLGLKVASLLLQHSCNVVYETINGSSFAIDPSNTISASIFQDNSMLSFDNGVSVLGSKNGGIGLIIDCNIPSFEKNMAIRGLILTNCFNPPIEQYSNAIPMPVMIRHGNLNEQDVIAGYLSFANQPNTDGSYNAILMTYGNQVYTDVKRIHLSFNNPMV